MMSILTTVKSCLKTAGAFAKANSPVICTGMALVGLAATVVSVVKATKKCTKLVEKATEEKGAPLTTKETVKVCWKTCVAAIIAVAITGAAIVSAQALASAKLKTLAGLYSAALASKDAVVDAIEEDVGKDIADAVKKKVSKEKAEEIVKAVEDQKGGMIIFDDTEDAQIWVDTFSGQMFKATDERVNKSIKYVQRKFANQDMARVEDFYKHLNWPSVRIPSVAHDVGWVSDYERHLKGWVPDIETDAFKDVDGTIYSYIDLSPDQWLDNDIYMPF
jgi:hypothetical protein